MLSEQKTKINVKVKRFDPEKRVFVTKTYEVEVDRFTTVLSMLLEIKQWQDPTLSIRYSCRMGICGSCAMVVNGKPTLACETNVFSLAASDLTVEPMRGHPVLRDLVTDFEDFFERHKSVSPWLIRKDIEEKFRAEKEYTQTRTELDYYLPFSYCIKCGLCVDACPVVNTNPKFVGPQALSQAYRYYADSRDEGLTQRLESLDSLEGVWGCEFAGSCSRVCPKGVDPALAIQLLKAEIAKLRIFGKTTEKRSIS
ncbi:succinate dehydrogenase iron-sulfur subunit [Candidatus Marsarchaeota G2 archaeon ECH_B_SAG-G16]|uniref:succinate dehydrogenase n=6 Tax=Candidatus Marsarchaeota TaxID=1978152 RepID=A0A2R6A9S3_9ARCH|nr:MAG: succinate dehydrogenase iron-sulfur subunit [Candidatus Marsarchaeota G1 archaeon BE_D]PSN83567.1 MAG: succinate dehydrogenase iron-sulfur subunit [Candidatus Marsarchaeota G1 archaeon OSP_D]PSN89271.1 MAG: succinate dehydrogenase iron-sulfur subunit [Candidatus Marsarchaeota G1 archaeon OSP_C]PSO05855.1 MAG: succinate dehydrogenase iron-sulfur subunit [Candidatus Marsarchaeota G2 archaeon ECH_B_SAG-G16]